MDLECGGGMTVDVDEANEIVLVIVVTTDKDVMMGGGIGITEVEVVLVNSLLLVCGNVTGIIEGIETGIVDIFETDEELRSGVETIDELGKKIVVVTVLFVTLTKLLGNPREGVMVVDTLGKPIEVPRLVLIVLFTLP